MAKKYSTNKITNLSTDWSNDPSNNLPYSGESVQNFIKEQLEDRVTSSDFTNELTDQLNNVVFDNGNRDIVTGIEGNSELLTVTKFNAEGKVYQETIDIGSVDVNDRFIVITSTLSDSSINLNGNVSLAYGFTVSDYQNELIAGSSAKVSIKLTKQGASTPFYSNQIGTIMAADREQEANQTIDLTNILKQYVSTAMTVNVTLTVEHTYTYMDGEEEKTKTITKYSSTNLVILNLELSVTTNLLNSGSAGQITIPYTVKGNGSKTVYLYRDGKLEATHDSLTASSVSGSFIQTLPSGKVNFQVVAETKSGNTTVTSKAYYFDMFGAAASTITCLEVVDTAGNIQIDADNSIFAVDLFTDFSFKYYTYNPTNGKVNVNIYTDEINESGTTLVSNVSEQVLERKIYTYSKKIKSANEFKIYFKEGDTTLKSIRIQPKESEIKIDLSSEGVVFNLDADGRSNEETVPDVWKYGEVETSFDGLNWESNGWITDENSTALCLQNGAKATINYPLFRDIDGFSVTKETGCTFEILFKCSNATLDEHPIISCMWQNDEGKDTGLYITTKNVGVKTGLTTDYSDDDGKVVQTVDTHVGQLFAEGSYYKYTFILDPKAKAVGSTTGLCYGFINGILCYIAPMPSSFMNKPLNPISIDSTYADVYIKTVKYYNRAFTFDECVDSYIVDQSTLDELETLYKRNDILDENIKGEKYVSPAKLHNLGKGVIIISPSEAQETTTTLQDLNGSSNKKNYYGPFVIDYFAPSMNLNYGGATTTAKGNAYNFTHKECAIRIQGTTSTKRPRKNYRFHLDKKTKSQAPTPGSFIVGGEVNDDFVYSMSEGATPVPLLCMKADFVDSSMTHNTGGAIIFNELTKTVPDLRNPAQKLEYKNAVTDIKTRVSVEGFPVDIFAADSKLNDDYTDILDDENYTNLVYMGQYNFNNDKSSSGEVFGFDGAYKYDDNGNYNAAGPYEAICWEFLDNNGALDLFQVQFDTNNNISLDATYAELPDELELRAPALLTDEVADNGIASLQTYKNGEYKYVYDNTTRLIEFLGTCAKEVATNNKRNAVELNSLSSEMLDTLDWTSATFKAQADQYFNMFNICSWYLWTDYIIGVDQRAKNMMLYTMDGKHWMLQYYDGDTVLGERNDCFLAYDYLTDRTTWDQAAGQYALQGHDSWLWYLVRANFGDYMDSVCSTLRTSGKFDVSYFKKIFNEQIVRNWAERNYNYSQDYRYIQPLQETFSSDIPNNFINTAQGSRESHRNYILENRFNLLDSKYKAGDYLTDAFGYYSDANISVNKLKIVSSIPYYFAWNTSNTSVTEHQQANESNNYTVTLNVKGNTANNPANVLGASRIKELYFDKAAGWNVDSSKLVKLPALEKLDCSNSKATGDLYLIGCDKLMHINVSNTSLSSINGIEDSRKIEYINTENTNISKVKIADGCNIKTLKLGTVTSLILSNLTELSYTGDSTVDSLTAQNWSTLSELSINNCPNIDWEKLVERLKSSTATNKFLRITGLNITQPITWLDQFTGYYALTSDGNQYIGSKAALVGSMKLTEYVADEIIAEYRAMFPDLDLQQPEFTLLELDDTVLDESKAWWEDGSSYSNITNLDNMTGYKTKKAYEPSGHIQSILNGCHRYLTKITTPGSTLKIPLIPTATSTYERSLNARKNNGAMTVIQLADDDSRYYAKGYDKLSTRKTADLSGDANKGIIMAKIPHFWYKGINYNTPIYNTTKSKKFIAFSTYDEKPARSSEIKEIEFMDLFNGYADDTSDGLFRAKSGLLYNEVQDNIKNRYVDITSTAEAALYSHIYRVKVEGYKKIMLPCDPSVTNGATIFTTADGTICANADGNTINVGEYKKMTWMFVDTGMPIVLTIPSDAVYVYFAIGERNWGARQRGASCYACHNVVLHKGSNFTSGDEMTDENASEWLVDMEDWVEYKETYLGIDSCTTSDTGLSITLDYTGNHYAAKAGTNTDVAWSDEQVYSPYHYAKLVYDTGYQTYEYEDRKILSLLFLAKYGRKNSQAMFGYGSSANPGDSKMGSSDIAKIGMRDAYGLANNNITNGYSNYYYDMSEDKDKSNVVDYLYCNFLGVMNPFQNGVYCFPFSHQVFTQDELDDMFEPTVDTNYSYKLAGFYKLYNFEDGTYRLCRMPYNQGYPRYVRLGRYCDFTYVGQSIHAGTYATGYCDSLSVSTVLSANNVKSLSNCYVLYSGSQLGIAAGAFCIQSGRMGYQSAGVQIRFAFKGSITEVDDPDYFNEVAEYRQPE
jgi:hypothetical protein